MRAAAHDVRAPHHNEIPRRPRRRADLLGHWKLADARAQPPEDIARRHAVVVMAGHWDAGISRRRRDLPTRLRNPVPVLLRPHGFGPEPGGIERPALDVFHGLCRVIQPP